MEHKSNRIQQKAKQISWELPCHHKQGATKKQKDAVPERAPDRANSLNVWKANAFQSNFLQQLCFKGKTALHFILLPVCHLPGHWDKEEFNYPCFPWQHYIASLWIKRQRSWQATNPPTTCAPAHMEDGFKKQEQPLRRRWWRYISFVLPREMFLWTAKLVSTGVQEHC